MFWRIFLTSCGTQTLRNEIAGQRVILTVYRNSQVAVFFPAKVPKLERSECIGGVMKWSWGNGAYGLGTVGLFYYCGKFALFVTYEFVLFKKHHVFFRSL